MGRLQAFLLLLALCVFASFVSAQSASVEFVDEWGEATSRVLEQSRVLLRVVDPAADSTAGRDSVAVDLSAVNGPDTATAGLEETGGATGVFEGEVFLTTDYALDNIHGMDADQLYTAWVYDPDPTLDTATAAYGAATNSVQVGLAEARFVDAEGRATDFAVAGASVHVRVRDAYADVSAGPDFTTAVLTTSDGDSEVLTLTETGARTRTYLGSLPVVLGTPVAGDGRIQSAHGEALTVTHAEPATGTTSSSDTATVAGTSVSFVRTRDGRNATAVLADSPIGMRLIDASRNLDPAAVDTQSVSVSLLDGGDSEVALLRETGPDTGVFEGSIQHVTTTYQTPVNGYLESVWGADTVRLQHEVLHYSSAEAPLIVSTTRLVDESGEDSESVALGGDLRVEVENAVDTGASLDVWSVEVRSLATNDLETLRLVETDGRSYLFTGSIPVVPGAAASGDGRLQAQAGEAVEVVADVRGATSSGQAAVVGSSVRFVDEAGQPRTVLLEETDARVRILDPLSAGQAPPAATIRSRISRDAEPLGLAELPGSPGLFEASIPMRLSEWGDGILTTGREHREADAITAGDGRSSASLLLVPAVLEVLNGPAAAVGDTLSVRVTAPREDPSADPDWIVLTARARATEGFQYVYLQETGGSTGVFEGTLETVPAGAGSSSALDVAPSDTVELEYDASTYTGDATGRVTGTVAIVPLSVRLVDGQGEAAASYLIGEDLHVRVAEPGADTDPATAETATATVSSRRYGDDKDDVETVTLAETGPGTGVFTGSLPTALLGFYDSPVPGDGLLQLPESLSEPDNDSAVTATRSGVSATARVRDSRIWLADAQGQEADSFAVGSPIQVWMRRPLGDTTAEADVESVQVEVKVGLDYGDSQSLQLAETGGGTGLFTAMLPTAPPPIDYQDGTVQASPGDLLLVQRNATYGYNLLAFDTAVFTGDGGGEPANQAPDAVDDSAATDEDTPAVIAVGANDTDPDGDTIEVFELWQPANGSAVLNPDQTVIYTPNPGFSGTDSFLYVIRDGPEGSSYLTDAATITVTVVPVNDPPDAVDDSAVTDEDTALNFNVAGNDTDPDGDDLVISAVTQGPKGSVVINESPSLYGKYVIYTPNPDANGSDSFTYTVTDGYGGTDTATVNMTITPVNDVPKANTDSATTSEDTPVTLDPRANDTDVDGDSLTITFASNPNRGSTVINADGTVTYTPDPNLNGSDSFLYTISDDMGGTWSATVSVTVTPVNDPPVANNDIPSVQEDTPVTINVLSNDSDIDGDTLTVTLLTQPTHGTAVLNPDQTVTYTPELNYSSGTDTFTYSVSDGNGGTAPATVYLNVAPVNDPPVANADTATVAEDGTVTIPVAANDNDPDGGTLTLVSATQGAHGTVTVLADNQVSYQPAANYAGPDTFTYAVRDPASLTATGTVSVTVTPVNDPPVANADSAATDEDTPVAVPVLANDADVDGGALSVSNVTQGSNGVVTTDGATVTYTPAAGFSGADSFTYNVSDGNGGTSTALVTISVAAVNDAPVAAPDSGSTGEGVPVIIPVLANDTDEEGNTLTVTAVDAPGVLLPDDTVQYTPDANFTGTVTFGYTVSDGQGGTADGQVTVVVGEALERVAILATNSAWLRSGAVVLSGDVIVNQASAGPYLNGAELSLGGSVTTAAGWDVEADSLTVAAGAVIGGDVSSNQLTNDGTIDGLQRSPLALPVFPALPAFLTAAPGGSNVNVGNNGTRTLASGSYLDLVVGRKGTVTFTGGVYHFRSIRTDREAKLLFEDASEVRVQQRLSTKNLTTVGPAAGASIDASAIVFYVAGINGTGGGLAETPKAVDIGVDNVLSLNLYAPNGTTWLQDGSLATGAFLGKDIDVGLNVQVTLDSAY